MSRLHIVFGDSGAGSLKQALAGRNDTDRVVSLGDDLSWGPIGGSDASERIAYLDAHCPIPGGWSWLAEAHEEFRQQVSAPWDERLIWLGSASAAELAGYLFYLDRFRELPANVVRPDAHLPPHPQFGPAGSIGVLNASNLAEVLEHAPRRPISDDAELYGRWAELVAEGALLRVLDGVCLVSAPIDHFDHLILDAVGSEWKLGIRVIGDTLGAAFDVPVQINSDFLFMRLAKLAKSGALEADGEVLGWSEEMRRLPVSVRRAVGVEQ